MAWPPPAPAGPSPAAARSPVPVRLFRGNGFSIRIPAEWADSSTYTLTLPSDQGAPHSIWITPDTKPRVTSLHDYLDFRIEGVRQTNRGWRLAGKKEFDLAPGLRALRAESRWFLPGDVALYQRQILVSHQGVVFALQTQMTKRERATIGPSIDRTMLTFRPAGFAPPKGTPPPPAPTFRADLFTMAPGEGWIDETLYVLAEPDESRFRRNLVIRRDPKEIPPEALEDYVRAEEDAMALAIPGMERVEDAAAKVQDGQPARRLVIRRRTKGGGVMLQTQLFAPRKGALFTLTLTTERDIPPQPSETLAGVIGSFSTAPEPPAPAGGPRP